MILSLLSFQVFATLIGFALAIWMVRKRPHVRLESLHRQVSPFLVGLLIALWGVGTVFQQSDTLNQIMPFVFQRHCVEWNACYLTVGLGLSCGFVVAVGWLTKNPQRELLAAATIALQSFLVVSNVGAFGEVNSALSHRESTDGIILQSHSATCAAATLANIANLHGHLLSERQAVELLGTTSAGTNRGQIRSALHQLGVEFHSFDDHSLSNGPLVYPAFLFVDHPAVGKEGHTVAYLGQTSSNEFEIWDPLVGRDIWSQAMMKSRWHGAGIACPLSTDFASRIGEADAAG